MTTTTNGLAFFGTNTAFLTSQIPLASFVPKKKQPYQDVQTPYEVELKDYSVRQDEAFDTTESTSSGSLLSILATKFASISHQKEKAASMHVSAIKGGNVYSLNNPDDLFEQIIFGSEHAAYMQQWFERCARRKWKPRFVVGLRTFFDASVSSAESKQDDTSGSMTVPISSAQGDPTGAADLKLRAQHKSSAEAQGELKMGGERVYSVCYWKVNISKRGGKVTPELKSQKNVWRAFHLTRGTGDGDEDHSDEEEEFFQADLGGSDNDMDGWKVYDMKAGDEAIHLAFPIGSDEEDEESGPDSDMLESEQREEEDEN